MNNIYLIGMMGSGKTVTGKSLAKLQNMTLVDLDHELEARLGKSISEIFEKDGESFFRLEEKKTLNQFTRQEQQIISTGGGIVLDSENIKQMRNSGKVIYLETSPEWLWKRVKDKTHRPLLKGEDPKTALEKILSQRKAIYEAAANIKVTTDGKTADEVAEEIAKKL